MCELLAITTSEPVELSLSLARFARHGGRDGLHGDGWGFAWYEQGDVQLIREAGACAHSETARWLTERHRPSQLFLGHIRHATQGEIALRNTQPFQRETGGATHLFAHNGDLNRFIHNPKRFPSGHFRPVGETDSERAFCVLMARMAAVWQEGRPESDVRLAVVADFAARLRQLGPANFLYSDGELLFAHSDRRRQASGEISAPGLHLLQCEASGSRDIDGLQLEQREGVSTVMLASVPLDDRPWEPLPEGEVLMFRDGVLLETCPRLTLWHETLEAMTD
ncbi:class II glutamine amidotransferase [Marinobacterium sediminicola]|uniref:Glutamine amidotransferase n=1 Tax=Marinobacterium sediminicola TaxID=518898 RepID=A0ABY1RX09_9GAMM|nr:class II glutamine amidotransferase [Marinobacterium sediminicola]ULG67938.1 class II glutamine amidotransferase [Marinobacterium sediminicola]SMR71329.1 glutamine amidotransferase [Marinobacterium sediminicola]